MSSKVRAKFQVSEATETAPGSVKITMNAVYDDKIEEDKRFAKATPTGHLDMQVDNPAAAAFFKPGHSYYLDFTEIVVVQPPKHETKPAPDEEHDHARAARGEGAHDPHHEDKKRR